MGFVGTFGAFTTARLGIYTSQKGLEVTGNNISNINTNGYTRQMLDQISLRTGGADRYQSQYDTRVGNGALSVGVSQIRDPYLDIRYRSEMANVGALDTKLAGLNDLAAILDEVAKGGSGEGLGDQNGLLTAQFSEFLAALDGLKVNTGDDTFDTQVRIAAETLTKLFRSTASRLEEVYNNTVKDFNQDIEAVNKLLTNIRDLNASIRKSELHGDSALEQRDQRNLLIDELSQYMKIDVIYSMEDVGGGQMVEKLTIKLGNANPDQSVDSADTVLVDGIYAGQLGITQVPKPNPNYDPAIAGSLPYLDVDGNPTDDPAKAEQIDDPNFGVTVSKLADSKNRVLNAGKPDESQAVALDDNDLYGSLQAQRELLTESGEFTSGATIAGVDEDAATKRGIKYYQKSLDLLARQFAETFNNANQGYMVNEKGNYVDADGKEIVDLAGNPVPKETPLTPATEQYLKDLGVPKVGGNLFSTGSNGDDGEGITAANISIAHSWSTGDVHLVASFVRPDGLDTGSTDSSNILHMVALMGTKMDFFPGSVQDDAVNGMNTPLFHGTFQEMLTNMETVLGSEAQSTNILLNNHHISSVDLDTSRLSISSVDLNDEAMNLMQYQKSYSAACRLMTALDQVLDKLINGTGTAGL